MPKWNSQKIIVNKWIPFDGYSVINIFGVLYTKDKGSISEITLHHEYIHTLQVKETFGFMYLIYIVEYIIKGFIFGFSKAYREISFEKEAYYYEKDLTYTTRREKLSWLKFLYH